VIFADTNVWMYAVGRPHPLRDEARELVRGWVRDRAPVATSSEVLQELLHAYVPVGRLGTLDAALRLSTDIAEVWPLEAADALLAADLAHQHGHLAARDLAHLATCLRRGVDELASFDRGLAGAFDVVAGAG
jgi:predicted nucleic acid-binding protein